MYKIQALLKNKALYYCITRYLLSSIMMGFGIMKILGTQFANMNGPYAAWQTPLELLEGRQLAWAFFGYSHWFQVVLGIFEFVPASLLLFRRTAFIGAVLLFPMTLSVFLVNYALHLWEDTKLLALCLIVLNLLIFLFEWKKVKLIFSIAFDKNRKYKYILPEVIVAVVLIIFPIIRKTHSAYFRGEKNILTGDWRHRRQNEFTLLSEKINDSTLPCHLLKAYFGPEEEYSEINDSVNSLREYSIYSINEHEHTLNISPPRYVSEQKGYFFLVGNFQYEMRDDTQLVLRKKVNGTTNHAWIFKKRVMTPYREY